MTAHANTNDSTMTAEAEELISYTYGQAVVENCYWIARGHQMTRLCAAACLDAVTTITGEAMEMEPKYQAGAEHLVRWIYGDLVVQDIKCMGEGMRANSMTDAALEDMHTNLTAGALHC